MSRAATAAALAAFFVTVLVLAQDGPSWNDLPTIVTAWAGALFVWRFTNNPPKEG